MRVTWKRRPSDSKQAGDRVTSIGPYSIQGVLGRGGMGVIYRVQDPKTGHERALKTIDTAFLAHDPRAKERFFREIDILSGLDHPGVIKIFDHGTTVEDGHELAYYVMEKLEGRNLQDVLNNGERLQPWVIWEIARSVAEVLDYLQSQGVLHRDIKPDNLFLESDLRVVLIDFGLARTSSLSRLTQANRVIGSIAHTAPEILRGAPPSPAADIFGLGVALFQLFTGYAPFEAVRAQQRLTDIDRGPRWPHDLHSQAATQTKELIADMLTSDPEARPSPEVINQRARNLLGY